MKKIFLWITFVAFWVITILNIILDHGTNIVIYSLVYITIFLPLTISIIFKKDEFCLLILLLYSIVNIIILMTNFFFLIDLVEIEEIYSLINSCVYLILFIFILVFVINCLRNRKTNKIWVLLTGCLGIILSVIANILFKFELSYIKDILLYILILLYISSFDKKEIIIFK